MQKNAIIAGRIASESGTAIPIILAERIEVYKGVVRVSFGTMGGANGKR